jgi:hypothetical protein
MSEIVENENVDKEVRDDHFLLKNDVIVIELSPSTPLVKFEWNPKLTSDDIDMFGIHALADNELNPSGERFSIEKDSVDTLKNKFLLLNKDTIYQQLESIYVNLGRQCFLMDERGIVPPSFKKEEILCIRDRYTWFPSETIEKKSKSDDNKQWMYDLSMFIIGLLHEYMSGTDFTGSDEQVQNTLKIINGSPLFFSMNRALKENKKERVYIHM